MIKVEEGIILSEDQQNNQKVVEAKQKELSMMESYYVFEEIEKANHQCNLSRWVVTEKFKTGKQAVKARLVSRGFEEDLVNSKYSPTCSTIFMIVVYGSSYNELETSICLYDICISARQYN